MASISCLAVDEYLWQVRRYLWKKTGSVDAGNRLIDPLHWYVQTGRASVTFLHKLTDKKPYVIGRQLLTTGQCSTDEAIRIIRQYLGLPNM